MTTDTPAIDIQHLSKRYGRKGTYAARDINIQVNKGEIYGFLGPNGAGKSTTIRMLMNFIQPTSGEARILGRDVVRDSVAIKQSIGYLSGDLAMYRKMTGEQFLDYMSELRGGIDHAYRAEITSRLQADITKRLGDLSRGNRQKIGIIQAFMHRPEILILDEPSSGLDPLMQEVFYDMIREAQGRGATIFMSSHILGEVQKICDRVAIIRDGQLVAERNIADMAEQAAQTFDIVFHGKPPLTALKKVPGLQIADSDGTSVSVHLHGELAPLFAVLATQHVSKIDARTLDLEEVFMHYYQHEGEEK